MPLVRIALRKGTTPDFRRAIGESIHRAVRPEDVFVNLIETQKENGSFGNGIAQYAT